VNGVGEPTTGKRQSLWELLSSVHQTFRSLRLHHNLFSLASYMTSGRLLLAVAIALGVELRFRRLDLVSMSIDEGFTWAAAGQQVSRLLQLQPILDTGKLPLYDLLLHYWMHVFGDSLRSMRGFSATISTISILLIFALVREVYRTLAEDASETGELAGGFGALLFATNVAILDSARTARMYPLMMAAELSQMLLFLRAQRCGRVLDYMLTAVFLALAIAANFTAAFILVGEAFWLAFLFVTRPRGLQRDDVHVAGPALSLVAGLVLLSPWRRAAKCLLREGVRHRDFGWIPYQPPLHWSYEVLRGSAATEWLFGLLLALSIFAIWRGKSRAPLVVIFMAAAAVGPSAAVAMASLFGVPMMVDRYVLSAIVAFLGLAAIGAASLESRLEKMIIFICILWSARAVVPPSVDWRQAAAIACAASSVRTRIGVVPVCALDVVRYHLPPARRPRAVGLRSGCGDPRILIVSPGSVSPRLMSSLKACYPRLLGRPALLEVRSG
jgi:uncharacterized membrane protein